MDSSKEKPLLELLNIIMKESSFSITNSKDLSDESKVLKIINTM